ncbi:hypothetical protein SprV_0200547400 [Sparganum proliferum]
MSQNRCEASGPPETLNLFWMTPILFSPDNLARSQRACLNLLKSLASVPQPIVTAHTDTAVPSATMRKPFKRTAACATAAAQRHRQAVICYLSACLRRLDELVPARGAGVPATTPVSSRGLPASTASSSVCSGGDLLVRTLWDLAVTPEEASVIQQQETTRASEGRLHTGSAAAQPGQRQRMRRTGAGGGSRLATATTSATEPAGSTNRTNATAAEPRSILPTDLHTASPPSSVLLLLHCSTSSCCIPPLDRSAACWEARLRLIFSLLSALTPPPPPSLLPADTCSAAPPMPVMQSILLPCVQMLETLAKAVPLLPPPSQLPSSRRPHTKSESAESTSATSRKLSDASASGKPERPAPAATTTDAKRASLQRRELLSTVGADRLDLPPVDFAAWM